MNDTKPAAVSVRRRLLRWYYALPTVMKKDAKHVSRHAAGYSS